RTAPPTIHASSPANSSLTSSRIDDHPPSATWIGVDPAGQLVVDRVRHASMGLGKDAVAEDRHGCAGRLLALELDRERVHRDHADHAPRLAADAHLRAGQVAAKAVAVADGDDPDPGRPLRDEAAAVAGALTDLEALDLREVAPPRERRLEAVRGGIVTEGRKPIERDAAASGVEARRGQAQRRSAVRDVA